MPLLDIQGSITIQKNSGPRATRRLQANLSGPPISFHHLQSGWRAHVFEVFARPVSKYAATVRNQPRHDALDEVFLPRNCSPWPERFASHYVKRGIDQISKELVVRMWASVNRSNPVVRISLQQVRVLRMVVRMHQHGKVGLLIDMA